MLISQTTLSSTAWLVLTSKQKPPPWMLTILLFLDISCNSSKTSTHTLTFNSGSILLTYLLIPWSRVFLEKLTSFQLVKKFPAFRGTWRFITAFTSARHLSLSWASLIQSMPPHPTSWRSILILYYHLRLGLPSDLFPSGFPTKTLYTSLISPIHATCPAHLILLDFITRTILGEKYRSLSSSKKGKAIPLQAWTGPEGSRRLRLPDFKTIGTWRWYGCQSYGPAALTLGNIPGTHFC